MYELCIGTRQDENKIRQEVIPLAPQVKNYEGDYLKDGFTPTVVVDGHINATFKLGDSGRFLLVPRATFPQSTSFSVAVLFICRQFSKVLPSVSIVKTF